jgi:hypothetical protein
MTKSQSGRVKEDSAALMQRNKVRRHVTQPSERFFIDSLRRDNHFDLIGFLKDS